MTGTLNFSIIIPHKNIPKLLRRCLDSIPQREDLEVIIVDDNSDPKVVDFENFPGKERGDVKIILDKKGGCAGRARNQGLDAAKGKWLLFADADDYFTYCLGEMFDKYAESEADVVFFDAISLDSEKYSVAHRTDHLNEWIALHKENREKSESALRYMFGEPWCKMVRKSVVDENGIRFDEIPIHNDTAFSYLVGFYSKIVAVDEHSVYVVSTRKGSLSGMLSDEKYLTKIEVFAKAERFRKDKHIKVSGFDMLNKHYRTLVELFWTRRLPLFKQGISILRKYNSSALSVNFNIMLATIEFFRGKMKKVICLVGQNAKSTRLTQHNTTHKASSSPET